MTEIKNCYRCGRYREHDADGLCKKCMFFDVKALANQARACQSRYEELKKNSASEISAGRHLAYANHRWSDCYFILLRALLGGD